MKVELTETEVRVLRLAVQICSRHSDHLALATASGLVVIDDILPDLSDALCEALGECPTNTGTMFCMESAS